MSATGRPGGWATWAFSVAKLTVARTPSSLLSLRSTRAAHAAQVIPPTTSSTVRDIGRDSPTDETTDIPAAYVIDRGPRAAPVWQGGGMDADDIRLNADTANQ